MDRIPAQPLEGISEQPRVWNEPLDVSGYPAVGNTQENNPDNSGNASSGSWQQPSSASQPQDSPSGENPLLHELGAELRRQAKQAVESATTEASEQIQRAVEAAEQKRAEAAEEFLQRWKAEFDRAQSGARDDFSEQLSSKQQEFLSGLTSKFEEGFQEARELIQELDERTQRARHELQGEQPQPGAPNSSYGHVSDIPGWNQRLQTELTLAQSQWNELLQSSLDSGMQRLAELVADRSREVLRSAENKITERFAELRQPMAETLAEARDTLNQIRSALEQEMGQARSSLADIEHVASRVKEYSTQLDTSTHDTLNELHRRVEHILDSQTEEMNRRAENLISGVSQRLNPAIDSMGQQLIERAVSEVESRIAPHLEHVPDLLRDLAAREMQVEEGLRLHRERLRQISENSQRDVGAQNAAALSALKNDFEVARQDALPKWNENLSASGAQAAQIAAESMRESAEWFQQDAQARLQVMVEQTLAAAQSEYGQIASQATARFGDDLDKHSSGQVARIEQQLDNLAYEVSGRARTQMDVAAEAAAVSFGQLLHGISDQEIQQFTYASRDRLEQATQEMERSAQSVLGNFSAGAEISLEQFRSLLASQLETGVAAGRDSVTAEFGALLNQFVAERDVRLQEWTRGLERVSDEASEKHQGRLERAADSWMVSSVRRLNEHGQNVIESLMRSADQSLRNSCSRVLEGLAEMMRDRTTNSSAGGFSSETSHGGTLPENSDAQANSNWTNA